MSNRTTGAQRYNARMDAIFERAKGHGLVGDSGLAGHGVHSPAMEDTRKKAIKRKKSK